MKNYTFEYKESYDVYSINGNEFIYQLNEDVRDRKVRVLYHEFEDDVLKVFVKFLKKS